MADEKHIYSPARTQEGRENQLIALAHDVAEKQMLEGTASAQVITHFLKLGTEKERLEREKLIHENLLLQEKTRAYQLAEEHDALYEKVILAMKKYSGVDDEIIL